MAFNFSKLTVKAQEIIQNALEIAQNYNNQIIEPEHLLAAMIQDESGIAVSFMRKAEVNINHLKLKVNELLEKLPKVSGAGAG
ncbi:MAG TPA: Clp protease N-terminal domain-containing protein, partial [Ignavibacteriales bacterium]|nr:Clp protease N-terminal domain-containing protein [Ignavibacteriales bacterium]